MKRYITYIFAIFSLAYIASCTQSDEIANPNDPGCMALHFQSSTMTRSADDASGLNEDKIASLDCYFYPASGAGNAVWHYRVEPNVNGSHTIEDIMMPAGAMADVFGSGAQGKIYVIANYPGNDLPSGTSLENSSIAELKQKLVTTAWPQGASWAAQVSFVMDGEATISKSGNTISGNVNLIRAAAKIELTITAVQDEVTGTDGSTYVPALEGGAAIGLTMHNAAIKSSINNVWSGSELAYNADVASHNSLAGYTFTADGEQFKQTKPFYSYPTHWGAGPSGEAYLLLVVPWQRTKDENGNDVTGESAKPCYYEIPIGELDGNVISEHIGRNSHYQISIDVGTLGSFIQEEPITLTPSYMVVDWTSGEITAQIKDQKYLVVDQHHYVMNNVTNLEIPFSSSDACEIVSVTCTQTNLNTGDIATISRDDSATIVTNKSYALNIDNQSGILSLTHGVNNNLYDSTDDANGVFDFTPYEFTITIQHEGNSSFKETITIIQYPAMHGELQVNSGANNKGYTYVNGYQNSPSGTQTGFCNVSCSASGSGVSSNSMTIVSVSDLTGTDYIIGDPRVTEVDEALINRYTWYSAPSVDDSTTKRTLKYYYPAQRDLSKGANHPTHNMVAPKFRICSGYGAINGNYERRQYIEYMEGRCASYQEDGYPAGRWRLPTKAELEIINTLCEKGLLPDLFADIPYWTAHGYGQYNANTNKVEMEYSGDKGDDDVSLRCVYDDWYWGSERVKSTGAETLTSFTWGDMPR